MKKYFSLILALAFVALANMPSQAWAFADSVAGSSQSSETSNFTAEETAVFAKRVEKYLASQGARVAIVCRVGRPVSDLPPGVSCTHTAFWVYSQITLADGRQVKGYQIYNLYQLEGQLDRSKLVNDFPVDFFGGVHSLQAKVVIPTPKFQARLLEVIGSPSYHSLHNPNYSVLANPFRTQFQNCTAFTLDVVGAAIWETFDSRQIKVNLKVYFKPHPIQVNGVFLAFGAMTQPDVAMSDHDTGTPKTATFGSIQRFLEKYNMVSTTYTVW